MVTFLGFSSLCVFRTCLICALLGEKVLSHLLHGYGFFPLCVLRWISILLFFGKALSHWLHWYGFSPVWVSSLLSRLFFSLTALSQLLHWCDCFLVCSIICRLHGNTLLHWLHWYGFSPVWVRLCLSRLALKLKAISQELNGYGFSQSCAFM